MNNLVGEIYSRSSDGSFYPPFSLSVDDMEHLILINFEKDPDKGWIPNEKRLILKLLFMIVKVFKEWPKSYAWSAMINFGYTNYSLMKSSWRRI